MYTSTNSWPAKLCTWFLCWNSYLLVWQSMFTFPPSVSMGSLFAVMFRSSVYYREKYVMMVPIIFIDITSVCTVFI
jgi:hypothetical protein